MSNSVGSFVRKGMVSLKDGECVGNLRLAGAIPLLVSNTPEFCTSWETNNYITGRTLNPHDSRRSAGGSSGGEVITIDTIQTLLDYINMLTNYIHVHL